MRESLKSKQEGPSVIPKEMLMDLAGLGFNVESPAELRLKYSDYKSALPVLLWWLVKVKDVAIKEDLVRDLTNKDAPANTVEVLVSELHKSSDNSLRWAIGNAIGFLAKEKDAALLLRLSSDRDLGRSRQMLVSALSKRPSSETEKLLVRLLEDSDVKRQALGALAKIGGRGSIPYVEALLQDSDFSIRKKAAAALKSIERRQRKA